MKKVLFSLFAAWLTCMPMSAGAPDGGDVIRVIFDTNIVDDTMPTQGPHRTPPVAPIIYLDAETHVMYSADPLYDCSINLVDAAGEVVYSSIIPDGTEEFQLPLTLSGVYEL